MVLKNIVLNEKDSAELTLYFHIIHKLNQFAKPRPAHTHKKGRHSIVTIRKAGK